MAQKLTDEEIGKRTRTMQRLRSERQRQRFLEAGKTALTVWIDAGLKAALTTAANDKGATIGDTAEQWLMTAAANDGLMTTTTTEPEPTPTTERNKLILDLHRQGIAGREIARRLGVGKTTVHDVLKRMEAAT